MSADGTALAIAQMLESEEFEKQVIADPESALASLDLNPDEKKMLTAAAAEGITHIVRPESQEKAPAELSDSELENVAGGLFGIGGLSSYLNSRSSSFSRSTQLRLNQAIFGRFGIRASTDVNVL